MLDASNTAAATVFLSLSIVSSCFLGALVLIRNPWRRTHHAFALLTLNLALWSAGVLMIIQTHTESTGRFWIMLTFAVASFLPAVFYQFIGYFPYQRFEARRWILGLLYLGAFGLVIALPATAKTQWYIRSIVVSPNTPPQVTYGPVFYVFSFLVVVSMVFSFLNLIHKVKRTTGIQRRQVQHVLVSIFASTGFASMTNVLAPVLNIGTVERYGPCFVVLLMGGLAYSMVRYHLLDIWGIVSRTTVYAVVTSFVIVTFLSTVSIMHWLLSGTGQTRDILTAGLAALIVALVIQPLKERTQLVLGRMLVHRHYDAKALTARVGRYATEIVHHDKLLEKVADDLRQTVGVNHIRFIMCSEKNAATLVTEYSTHPKEIGEKNINLDYLMQYLQQHHEPVLLEKLMHGRPTEEHSKIAQHLAELGAYIVVPLRTTSSVLGMIALGEKTTRDIYTQEDVRALDSLAAPLATAIENARLYQRIEEVNNQLERIMANMRGAVIAVDQDGQITTVNQEASEMLAALEVGNYIDSLEPKVAEILQYTLKNQRGIADVETVIIDAEGASIPVAMSSSCFASNEGEGGGALVSIYNMTQIKRLESNVQRADRMTSIGTLAAGMAHEIKNPLQSIKTFTQLLPERYNDQDFRNTFSEIVPPEVERIDTIVGRLLDFARPKPVEFSPQNLSTIIENVIALLDNQLRAKKIRVEKDFPETLEEITADEQQLHQVFLNLFLNAMDAVSDCDNRCLKIRTYYDRTHIARKGQTPLLDVRCIKVDIQDTGVGIAKKDIEQLFTPFYTTKAEGSGLGLSVVHGIIAEHQGEINVTSIAGEGTTFTLTFPLVARIETIERVGA